MSMQAEPGVGGRARRPRVVIAGAGIAALEAVLALRPLVGERVEIELIAPDRELVYAPMTVAEPFERRPAPTFDLAEIASDLRVSQRHESVVAVEGVRRRVATSSGETIPYDALVLALGARRDTWLRGAIGFGGRGDAEPLRELLALLDSGQARRVAFAAPPGERWSLPLYELALLTAAHLRERGINPRVTVVTPEETPIAAFGPLCSDAVVTLLAARGIDCWCESYPAFFSRPRLQVVPDGMLFVDAVVALARLEGRPIRGVPHDQRGFIPIDGFCRVPGLDAVYAAGDGTTGALKQGGVAAQQADTVATHIASALGAPIEPQPCRPTLRGMLLTGDAPLYLQLHPDGASQVATEPPWSPPAKVAGRYLAPYLADLARSRGAAAAAH
jgi:sulfide:quinone oxidoreductase